MKTTCKIVATFLYTCTFSFAQPQWPADHRLEQQRQAQFGDFQAEDHDPLVPLAEREWNRKSGAPVPTVTITKEREPIGSPGTVSVKALQHEQKISEKSRKLVEKAEQQVQRQEIAEAEKTLAEAFVLEDARPYALAISGSMHLAEYIRDNKDPNLVKEALAELKEAQPLLPSDVGLRSNLGLAYYFAGDLDRALEETSTALQRDPARAKTRYVLGMILCAQGRYSEAAFHLKQASSEITAARDLLPEVERLAARQTAVAAKQ